MAEVASAYVSLMPSAKGFGRSLDGQIGGQVDASGKKAGSRFGGALKAGLLGAAGVGLAAGAAAIKFAGGALDEAREAQVVGARTENVIKKMGGAANVTAKQVGNLAGALSAKTGIDDEAIQAGQNLLLTFGNIRNEAGKGNDIFNQTSKLMVDLSAAMGTDAKGSAIQLGKALNDPVKGVSALSRVGVSFNDVQKEQIKNLVATGDTMGAQKIILGELTKQFGGAAETMATPADKAKVAFGNLQEQVGTKLLPVVDKLATFATNKVIPAISGFVDSLGKGSPIIQQVGNFVRANLLPPIQSLADWVMTRLVPAIVDFGRSALPAVKTALESVRKGLSSAQPFFQFLGNIVTTVLLPVLGNLAKIILPAVGKAVETLGKAFGALGRIGTALWNNALQPAFKFIVNGIASILDLWSRMLGTLAKVPGFGWAKKAADAMADAADKARGLAADIKKIPPLKNVNVVVSYQYKGLRSSTRGGSKDDPGSYLPRALNKNGPKQAFDEILKSYGDAGKKLMDRISAGIKSAKPKAVKAAQDAFDALKGKLEQKRDDLASTLDGLKDEFNGIKDSVSGAFTGGLFDVSATLNDAGDVTRTVAQNFIAGLTDKKAELTGLIESFNTLKNWGVSPAFLTQLFASGNGALITELAGMSQADALGTANLFGDVANLGSQLGTAVATNDAITAEIQKTNDLLTDVKDAISYLAEDIGAQLNDAAAKARRNKKRNGKDD